MKPLVLASLFLLRAVSVSADFDPAMWQYSKKIQGPLSQEFVLLDLDEEVFNSSNDNLSDLRIIDERGREVPYTLVAEGDRRSVSTLPVRLFDKSFIPGESTVFTLDIGASGQFHNRLIIYTGSENFRRMVEVEGNNDGKSWRFLTNRGQIYDYTLRDPIKPVSVQDTSVSYPESTVRYLRVRILDRGETPLEITGASLERRIESVAREGTFEPKIEIFQNSEEHATEIVADLGVRGIPTRRVLFDFSENNFNRQLEIFASNNPNGDWRFITSNYIFKVNTEKFQGENLLVQYPETQTRYLKFIIYNRDDKPLTLKDLRLKGTFRALAFKIEDPNVTYSLYYGNLSSRRAEYDIEKLFPYLDTAAMNHVELGREMKNDKFSPPKPPLTERNPNLLPVFLGLIVAVLGFLLLRLFAKNPVKI